MKVNVTCDDRSSIRELAYNTPLSYNIDVIKKINEKLQQQTQKNISNINKHLWTNKQKKDCFNLLGIEKIA